MSEYTECTTARRLFLSSAGFRSVPQITRIYPGVTSDGRKSLASISPLTIRVMFHFGSKEPLPHGESKYCSMHSGTETGCIPARALHPARSPNPARLPGAREVRGCRLCISVRIYYFVAQRRESSVHVAHIRSSRLPRGSCLTMPKCVARAGTTFCK